GAGPRSQQRGWCLLQRGLVRHLLPFAGGGRAFGRSAAGRSEHEAEAAQANAVEFGLSHLRNVHARARRWKTDGESLHKPAVEVMQRDAHLLVAARRGFEQTADARSAPGRTADRDLDEWGPRWVFSAPKTGETEAVCGAWHVRMACWSFS